MSVATPCADDIHLYRNPLLEEPPAQATASDDTWAEYEALVSRARASCASCPQLADCLYTAVVQTDVAGYVGCTTPQEREAIRDTVGVSVCPEDMDSYSGARGQRQPVQHAEVVRLRGQHPDESLEWVAERLGCSLSTVKRHLRRARAEGARGRSERRESAVALPTMDAVFEAFEEVVEQGGRVLVG